MKKRILRPLPGMDLPFLILVLTLVGFGLVMLASASSAVALYRRGDAWAYLRPQLLYAALGLCGMWLASRVDYHIFHKLAWPLLGLSLILLAAVLFMPEYNGCKRWLVIPGFGTLQPSEIAKFAVVLVFSHIIALNHDRMKDFSVGVLPFALVLGVVAALMLLEPHLSGTVLILGIVFNASESSYLPPVIPEVGDSVELWQLFSEGLPTYLHEIATSLLPIVVMFGIFQLAALHIDRRTLGRIGVGLVYTYIGLVLFLTGANIGFMPAGNYLGQVLGGQSSRWLLIPIGMLIGYFIVRAEPAVYVLNKQVEEVTDGAISAGTMGAALSAGVALSVGLAMVRVLTGISILWFLIPGYLFAISISFVVPKLYTAIAFDAGGVASGPMTATFLLPLAQGACIAVGGNIVTDAFGVVAMVAMTPLITVQLMGLVAQLKTRKARSAQPLLDTAALLAGLPDDAIIEL